jgi:membrane-associated phospholipid phosphatase
MKTRHFHISARGATFIGLMVLYAVVTTGIIIDPSPLLRIDYYWLNKHMWGKHPQYHWPVFYWVMLGQRGPATLAFLPLFIWTAWRRRTTQPLVLLVTSLILLNVSVGIVKYSIGRAGPRYPANNAHALWGGGNLYPSGHVANTVVLYGLLAWIAAPSIRKWVIVAAVFLSGTIGFGTIYLRTHWFSDVLAGWIAGAIVLVALPTFMPFAQRWADRLLEKYLARRARRKGGADAQGVSPPKETAPAEPRRAGSPSAAGQHVSAQRIGPSHVGRPPVTVQRKTKVT